MTAWLLLLPLISAFGGWVAYRLALQIFYRAIAFRKKEELATKIGSFVNHDAFSITNLGRRLAAPENLRDMRPLIEKHTEQFLHAKVKKTFPVLNVFIRGKTVKQLNHVFIEEMELVFPMVVEKSMNKFTKDFAPENMMANGLASLSPEDIKAIFQQTFAKELKYIQLISTGLGLLAGICIVLAAFLIVH